MNVPVSEVPCIGVVEIGETTEVVICVSSDKHGWQSTDARFGHSQN